MTVIPASRLSHADLCRLGNNVSLVVSRDRKAAPPRRWPPRYDEGSEEMFDPSGQSDDDQAGNACLVC